MHLFQIAAHGLICSLATARVNAVSRIFDSLLKPVTLMQFAKHQKQ
jgi:hypothetical protein